jgi:TatD DNase family protein
MLIDSHCHIHDPQYNFDAEQTLARAHAAGVDRIIVIGTSPQDNIVAQKFAAAHDNVYWSYGLHPQECKRVGSGLSFGLWKTNCRVQSEAAAGRERVVPAPASRPGTQRTPKDQKKGPIAIGEIGLDYHYKPYNRAAQIKLFEQMLNLAQQHNLPIIFHVREAFDDFWPIVDNFKVKNAVLHSFSDHAANLKAAIKRDFYIGVNGLVTFTTIPLPPLEHIILETDAPYLTPKPFRGKINEPSYVKCVAEWVAGKLKVPLHRVAAQTTHNTTKLFNL